MPAKKNSSSRSAARKAVPTKSSTNQASLWILAFIMLINAIAYGTIIPLLYPYAARFGIDPFGLSLLFASFSVAQLIATPILGRLSDKYGRKSVLLWCVFGTGVSLAMFAAATNVFWLFAARMIDGVTGGNISVAQASIADSTDGNERAKSFGILGAAFGFGFLLGPALGGFMSQFGLAAPFWFASGMAMLGTVLGIFLLKETLPPHKRQTSKKPLFDIHALVMSLFSPTVGTILMISFMFAIAQNAFFLGMQSFTVDVLKLTPFVIGLMFTLIGVVNVLTQMVGLKWILAVLPSKKRVIEVTLLFSAILAGLLSIHTTAYTFIPHLLVFAVSFAVATPVLTGLLSERTEGEDQGIILGINQSYISLGQIIGPVLAGVVASRVSVGSIFWLAAFFFILAFIATYWLHVPVKHKVNV